MEELIRVAIPELEDLARVLRDSGYCVNLADGQERWAYEIGAAVTASPAVSDGFIVVGAEDGNVYAFKSPTGTAATKP